MAPVHDVDGISQSGRPLGTSSRFSSQLFFLFAISCQLFDDRDIVLVSEMFFSSSS